MFIKSTLTAVRWGYAIKINSDDYGVYGYSEVSRKNGKPFICTLEIKKTFLGLFSWICAVEVCVDESEIQEKKLEWQRIMESEEHFDLTKKF